MLKHVFLCVMMAVGASCSTFEKAAENDNATPMMDCTSPDVEYKCEYRSVAGIESKLYLCADTNGAARSEFKRVMGSGPTLYGCVPTGGIRDQAVEEDIGTPPA